MPSHDARRVSRRSVLQGAATAGAAGLAATALGAAVSPAAAAEPGASHSAPQAGGAAKAASGPLVVHVRDARSGDIEVFSGTSQIRLRDKDLAARISRAAG